MPERAKYYGTAEPVTAESTPAGRDTQPVPTSARSHARHSKTLAECTAKRPTRAEPAEAAAEERVLRKWPRRRTCSQSRTTPILTSNIGRKMTMTMRSYGYVIVAERSF